MWRKNLSMENAYLRDYEIALIAGWVQKSALIQK